MLAVCGLGVLAGVAWYAIAPRSTGPVAGGVVAFPVPDYPPAVVAASFALVTGVAGLLVGVAIVGLADAAAVTRSVLLISAGLVGSLLAYGVGALLGPGSAAAQVAAGAAQVQVPLTLPTPLLVFVWPAATAILATVGLLVSLVALPGGNRRDHSLRGESEVGG